jgi:hypothetical protein
MFTPMSGAARLRAVAAAADQFYPSLLALAAVANADDQDDRLACWWTAQAHAKELRSLVGPRLEPLLSGYVRPDARTFRLLFRDALGAFIGGHLDAKAMVRPAQDFYRELTRIANDLESDSGPSPGGEGGKAEEANPGRDQGEAGQVEGADASPNPPMEGAAPLHDLRTTDDDLTDRQCLILETMLEHGIASERRRQSRAAIVRLINRTHKAQNYNRDFAALAKRGLLQTREGPGGGCRLTIKGKAEAERLRQAQ